MTDREAFEAFFRQYGVPHTVYTKDYVHAEIHVGDMQVSQALFYFDADGRFIAVEGDENKEWEPRKE